MLVNPYIAGNPVGGSEAFVGRADILRTVLRVLKNPGENGLVLYGQRRIGKTSVLLELMRRLPQEGPYQPIYFDLQDKAALPLTTVLRELMQRVASATSIPVPMITNEALPEQFQTTFLSTVLQQLPSETSLVLLLDEFDVLDNPGEGQAGAAFFPYLRNLLTFNPRLQFVFVIGRRPEDLSSLTLSIFKGIKAERVSLLTMPDTVALMQLSVQNGSLHWAEDAIAQVCALTGGHPFLTQQLCQELWETAWQDESDEPPLITLAAVEAAIDPTLRSATNALEWLWDGLRPAQRIVAAALAEAGPDSISQEELESRLQQSGVRILVGELQDAPRTLQDWDLLEPETTGYRFRVELLRRWLVQNKPLARVQQESDFVQPTAEKLFQAAYAFYQAGQLEQALPLLSQAVALNPNHVRGTLVLSEILLAQNEIDEAQQLLESLYQYHPAAARPRLVQVLLAQGDTSNDEEQRRTFYTRALNIEPNQIENLVQKAAAYFKTGQLEEAMLILLHLVAFKPDHVHSILLLSEILVEKDLVDEAQQQLETLYQHEPEIARPRLVKVLQKQAKAENDDQKRLALYEHILDLDPNHEGARKSRQQILLDRISVLEKDEQYEEALKLAKTIALELPADHPDQPDLVVLERKTQLADLYQRGLKALKANDRSNAIQWLVQVVALEPTYRETTRYLYYAVTGADSHQLQDDLTQTLHHNADPKVMREMIKREAASKVKTAEALLESEQTLRRQYQLEAKQLRQQIEIIKQPSLPVGFWRQPPAYFTWSLAALSIILLLYIMVTGGPNSGLATATATVEPVETSSQMAQAQPPSPLNATRWGIAAPTVPTTGTFWIDNEYADIVLTDTAVITFVYVPAGSFLMGSSAEDSTAASDEKPQYTVTLDAFWIMQTEVTNTQYGHCIAADVCTAPNNSIWNQAEFAQHPVTHVDWEQATQYAAWVGGRLPTEAEWEKTARGTAGYLYPWGNEWDSNRLNFCDKQCEYGWKDESSDDGYARTAPVGSYPTGASPYGALDMAGNVWEWVADWYNEGYYATSDGLNPLGPARGDYRVLRGGSWNHGHNKVRTTFRFKLSPLILFHLTGFRVVRVSVDTTTELTNTTGTTTQATVTNTVSSIEVPAEVIAIFTKGTCFACHVIPGMPTAVGQVGPNLSNIGLTAATRIEGYSAEEYLRESLLEPNAFIASECPTGPCLPNLMVQNLGESLTTEEIDTIVAYLGSIGK